MSPFQEKILVWGMHFLSRAICECSSKTFLGCFNRRSFILFAEICYFIQLEREPLSRERSGWLFIEWNGWLGMITMVVYQLLLLGVSVSWALPPFICGCWGSPWGSSAKARAELRSWRYDRRFVWTELRVSQQLSVVMITSSRPFYWDKMNLLILSVFVSSIEAYKLQEPSPQTNSIFPMLPLSHLSSNKNHRDNNIKVYYQSGVSWIFS